MRKFTELIQQALQEVEEMFPWELQQRMLENPDLLVIDVREPDEFSSMRIVNSINVPRGILEPACEYNYEDTVPELARARDAEIIVVCRSGNRSALAAYTMQQMGYSQASSLKTGLRGWNDYQLPLVSGSGMPVDIEAADHFFTATLAPEQKAP